VPSEAMALKAVLEPMLIRERRMVIQKETRTEFRGMSQPGRTYELIAISRAYKQNASYIGVILSSLTWARNLEYGRPSSRAKANI
jgi:hypothetical protein